MVNNLPAMQQETQVRSLGQEDLLEKEWQPTPVFLPGESHGQRRLEGYVQAGGWGLESEAPVSCRSPRRSERGHHSARQTVIWAMGLS